MNEENKITPLQELMISSMLKLYGHTDEEIKKIISMWLRIMHTNDEN